MCKNDLFPLAKLAVAIAAVRQKFGGRNAIPFVLLNGTAINDILFQTKKNQLRLFFRRVLTALNNILKLHTRQFHFDETIIKRDHVIDTPHREHAI